MTSVRYEAQAALFAARPSRRDLLDTQLPEGSGKPATINVWRNHAIESLLPLMEPYCRFGNWRPGFNLGPYDDTLMFSDWQPCDAELVWLDSSRFTPDTAWMEWLRGRLGFLRATSRAPIVLATWLPDAAGTKQLQQLVDGIPAVYFADLGRCCADESVELLDLRTAKLAGTPVSKAAQVILARELACHWLPAVVLPPLKAIALDLDQTLHLGVLGEDGIEGVRLTSGHRELQAFARSLRQRGVFVALVSRNEPADVEALFARREDYPLRWADFSVTRVSWGDKAVAVEEVANALRIGQDAVLFVDDNPGELASVAVRLPAVQTVYAHPDASLTRRVIDFYPGLWRWKVESDDARRVDDLRANVERESLARQATDPASYFRSLKVALAYHWDPREQLSRLTDLCNKTNQFNLALRRFSGAELAECMAGPDGCVASVQLKDSLSDSGVIAVIVAVREGERLIVEELCISCRALGRQLENTIVLHALRNMPVFAGCREVAFRVQHGPRNQPALDWLAGLLDAPERPSAGIHVVPAGVVQGFAVAEGVTLTEE